MIFSRFFVNLIGSEALRVSRIQISGIKKRLSQKVIDPVILNFLPARLAGGASGSQHIVCQIPIPMFGRG